MGEGNEEFTEKEIKIKSAINTVLSKVAREKTFTYLTTGKNRTWYNLFRG